MIIRIHQQMHIQTCLKCSFELFVKPKPLASATFVSCCVRIAKADSIEEDC